MRKIWQRYLFTEIIKNLLLISALFYFLFILIDFSFHSKDVIFAESNFKELIYYYLLLFTTIAEVLIPGALLVATIKVLVTLNVNNELLAMRSAGLSTQTILRPFLIVAVLCMAILYVNTEVFHSNSWVYSNSHKKNNSQLISEKGVSRVVLADNSHLFYQTYDAKKHEFFDVFWIKSFDEIFRIKTLSTKTGLPVGHYVDSIVRMASGELIPQKRFETLEFPQINFNYKTRINHDLTPDQQPLRHLLFQLTPLHKKISTKQDAQIITIFCYKFIVPLTCLLAVICPAPFCIISSRNLPILAIYALSILGLVLFFTLIKSSIILGNSLIISPYLAMMIPPALFFIIFSWKYAKL